MYLSNELCSGTRIPPRHKTGQVGRLKQDSPSTWIFSSNRRIQSSYSAKTECEILTKMVARFTSYQNADRTGRRSLFIIKFIGTPIFFFLFGVRLFFGVSRISEIFQQTKIIIKKTFDLGLINRQSIYIPRRSPVYHWR